MKCSRIFGRPNHSEPKVQTPVLFIMMGFERSGYLVSMGKILLLVVFMGYVPSALASSINGFTQMINAIEQDEEAKVRLLLKQGVNPNSRVDTRAAPTFLTHAAYLGRDKIITILIKAGANIHERNGDGFSPLMSAAWYGRLSTIKLLLSQGANPGDYGARGETLLSLTPGKKYADVIRILRTFDKDKLYDVDQLIMQEMVKRLLKVGENKTPDAAMKLYADRVDHYNDGKISKSFILQSKKKFFSKWPIRKYTLMAPATVLTFTNFYKVYFNYEYYIKNKNKALVGKAWNELRVQIKNSLPLIIKESGGAFPNTRKIKKMWKAKELVSIENMIPVFMPKGELAYLLSVRFTQRERCCKVGGILLRPQINQAREIKQLLLTIKSFDLDGDGVSEIETEGAHRGQGYTKGRKKLGFFTGWKFIELKTSEFSDNLGACRFDKEHDGLQNDCYSSTVTWKYIDLNKDGILDLREMNTNNIWNWKKKIKQNSVVTDFLFKDRQLIAY